jgi:phospholipid/cholesterol/gamma-HCH transport system substrate-binding protein
MPRTFRLGLFIVSALLVFSVGVFLIGDRRLLFSRTYTLTTRVTSVAGLLNGAEVRVGGTSRGTVSRIELPAEPGGTMVIRMKLHRSTRELIRADSVASIETDGVFGDKHIEISFGTPEAATLRTDEIAGVGRPIFRTD